MSKDILVLLFLQKLAKTFYLENVSAAVKSLLVTQLEGKNRLCEENRVQFNFTFS